MEKWQNTRKHYIQDSQQISLSPAGNHKAASSMTDTHETQTKRMHKGSADLELSVKKYFLLESLNMFDGTKLTLISDVDQYK